MYGPIQFAKKIGLKRVFTGQSALPALSPETRKGLIEEFEPDIAYVEQLLGRPLPEWRS
jgi:CubicO group peptidase (beta-lactamase class C family)